MNYVGKLLSNFKGFYSEINSATLTGAIDTIVVEQDDGSLVCSPFHVRFGKMGVLRSREKVVEITVNGAPVDLYMKLGESGEAFFVQDWEASLELPENLATSPLPSVDELMREGVAYLHEEAAKQQRTDTTSTDLTATSSSVQISIESDDDGNMRSRRKMSEHSTTSTDPLQNVSHLLPALPENGKNNRIRTESEHTALQVPGSSTVVGKVGSLSGLHRSQSVPELTNNSFLPIEMDESYITQGHVKVKRPLAVPFAKKLTDGAEDDQYLSDRQVGPNQDNMQKKKKKRKTSLKKRQKNRSKEKESSFNFQEQSTQVSSTDVSTVQLSPLAGDEQPDEIFEMDVEDDMTTPVTIPRATSLPIIEENRMAMTNDWARSQYAAQFHPFSDGDITPIVSPVGSRPPSPKSDTEVELHVSKVVAGEDGEQDDVKWMWGELPEKDGTLKIASESEGKKNSTEVENSGGLFHFMRKTKKLRHQPEQEGIYLDDLNLEEMDPEVAALYLYNTRSSSMTMQHKDEDNESGRGTSLPQSPISLDGAHIPLPGQHELLAKPSLLEDSGEHLSDLKMSLCGGLKDYEGEIPPERFMQGLVTFDDFCENPTILSNPDLVLKLEHKYYNWQVAGPMVMSVLAYQKPLPQHIVSNLLKQHLPKKEKPRRGVSSWFYWRRASADDVTTPTKDKDMSITSPISSPSSSTQGSPRRMKQTSTLGKSDVKEDESTSSDGETTDASDVHAMMNVNVKLGRERCKKSVRLTSEQLIKLNLKYGVNEVTFSVTTALQGTTRCMAYIFRWKYDDRIIISDIDGTITKSDVLGQLLPMVGKDWSQGGVAHLYTEIHKNGYKFLYLSARAIGQSTITRDYLRSIRQGELSLPIGPLLLSPSSLISAFHKEVIERKPEEFKIGCLRDVQALFPSSRNPFCAGFGNKINDTWAYRAVGLPMTRIFTINHRGELRHELTHTFQSSYWNLSSVVDHFFPPLQHSKSSGEKEPIGRFHAAEEFSTFTYWREPIPDVDIDVQLFRGQD